METIFKSCFLVNLGMEPDVLSRLLPDPIKPDVHNGEAFLSIVISDLHDMRPTFFPKGFGFNFSQIVYRAIVTCNGERGVHFLRSDADSRIMCLTGNLFSFFHFNHAKILNYQDNGMHRVEVRTARGEADITANYDVSELCYTPPESSVFKNIQDAKEYFAELYVAFSTLPGHTTAVRIDRTNWDVSYVSDEKANYAFMDGSSFFPEDSTRLDSIFYVEDLFYHWHTLEKSKLQAAAI